MNKFSTSLILFCMLGISSVAHGGEATDNSTAETEETGSKVERSLKLGVFLNDVGASNTANSLDPAIAGKEAYTSFVLSLDGKYKWTNKPHTVTQTLLAKYGKQYLEALPSWEENIDEIDYDGAYDYNFKDKNLAYIAWGADTVFSDATVGFDDALSPITGKLSAGYGQRFKSKTETKPIETNMFLWRTGLRLARAWGNSLPPLRKETEIGLEGLLRYETAVDKKTAFFVEYDVFAELDDMEHVKQTISLGLTANLNKLLKFELSVRAYREGMPNDAVTTTGYDEWSSVRSVLVGMSYTFK